MSDRGRRLFVFGDLNVDYVLKAVDNDVNGVRRPGGTAINAALAFQSEGFDSVIVGGLGNDDQADYLEASMLNRGLNARLSRSSQPTGYCVLLGDPRRPRRLTNCDSSANAIDPLVLAASLQELKPRPEEPVFVATHMLVRRPPSECVEFFNVISSMTHRVIADLVPHDLGARVSGETVEMCLKGRAYLIISALGTVRSLFVNYPASSQSPTATDWCALFRRLAPRVVAIRHGRFGSDFESVMVAPRPGTAASVEDYATLFESYPDAEKVGFGDRLTARLLRRLL